jgi:type VI secretion system secreted protein Hcp
MAQPIYLFLELANGGKIDGESTVSSLGRENSIECSSFDYGVISPREASSGLLTGRRQHRPVEVWKRIDMSTPLLLKALCENDKVVSAELKFFRPAVGGEGSEEHYYTVKLEEGYISGIEHKSEDALMAGELAPPAMEKVTFFFQDITWTYEVNGATHTDRWSGDA